MNPIEKLQQLIKITLVVASLLMTPIAAIAAETVNINRADAATMIENWKGIGEKKARAIVAYRKKNGPFASIDDLANVKGMGEGLIKNNRRYMSTSKGASKPSGKSSTKSTSKSSSKSTSKDKTAKKSSTTKKSTSKTESKPKKKSTTKSKKKECTSKSKDKACKKKKAKKPAKKSKKKSKPVT